MKATHLFAVLAPFAALAEPTGIFGFTGQTSATCNNCHSGGAAPTVTLNGPLTLLTSQSATYTLTITGGAGVRGGCDISQIGNATMIPGAGMRESQNELTHSTPGTFSSGALTFSFTVAAPDTAGSIKLYAAGLSANGNGSKSGDKAGTTSFVITVQQGAMAAPPDAGTPPVIDAGEPALPVVVDAGIASPDAGEPSSSPPPTLSSPAPLTGPVEGGCSAVPAPFALLAILLATSKRRTGFG